VSTSARDAAHASSEAGRRHGDQLHPRLLEADVHRLLIEPPADVEDGAAELVEPPGGEADDDGADRLAMDPTTGVEPAALARLAQRGAAEAGHEGLQGRRPLLLGEGPTLVVGQRQVHGRLQGTGDRLPGGVRDGPGVRS
jgi:hypothetical protein